MNVHFAYVYKCVISALYYANNKYILTLRAEKFAKRHICNNISYFSIMIALDGVSEKAQCKSYGYSYNNIQE